MGLMEVARRDPTLNRDVDVVSDRATGLRCRGGGLRAKEITLDCESPPKPGLRPRPGTLEHALIAMMVNAVEVSPLGARIRVVVSQPVSEAGPVCRIAVSDEGRVCPRMPGADFRVLVLHKQHGIGLGLALAPRRCGG